MVSYAGNCGHPGLHSAKASCLVQIQASSDPSPATGVFRRLVSKGYSSRPSDEPEAFGIRTCAHESQVKGDWIAWQEVASGECGKILSKWSLSIDLFVFQAFKCFQKTGWVWLSSHEISIPSKDFFEGDHLLAHVPKFPQSACTWAQVPLIFLGNQKGFCGKYVRTTCVVANLYCQVRLIARGYN